VHDAVVLHRHQHGVGCAVFLHQLQEPDRVELAHQHIGTTPAHRREPGGDGGVRVDRGRHHVHALRRELEAGEDLGGAEAHPVIVQDSLGHTGRTRAVDDVEVIFQGNLDARGIATRRLHAGVVAGKRTTREIEAEQTSGDNQRQPRGEGLHRVAVALGDEQHLRARVLQHQLQRVGRRHGGQGHRTPPRQQRPQERLLVFDAVAPEHRHPVPFADAEIDQCVRNPMNPGCMLTPVDAARAIDDGRSQCVLPCMPRDGRRDVDSVGETR